MQWFFKFQYAKVPILSVVWTKPTIPSVAQKAPFSRAAKWQNSSKIRVTILTPQISKLMSNGSTKHQIFAQKQIFLRILRIKSD